MAMLKSMTGYGKSVRELPDKRITAEIRSVNSRQMDLSLKIPLAYRDKELEIRSLITNRVERGKVDFVLAVENTAGQKNFTIDKSAAANYYYELKQLCDELSIKEADFLAVLTRLPDVIKQDAEQLSNEEWEQALAVINDALEEFDRFRLHEGSVLEKDFRERITKITELLKKTEPLEQRRITNLKERIRKNLRDFMSGENYDPNRFEQELFYYIEKLDFTEEKVRLQKHCGFFTNSLKENASNGKKLSFIVQEIGREINTLGSKANDAEIQMIVVEMKDELEKIKEQLLNIL